MNDLPDLEIAILGAGPAGVGAARGLGRQKDAVVFDPVFDTPGTKPCGGLLSEAAQVTLAAFGITVPLDLLVDPQCFAVTAADLASGVSGLYPRTYTNLDRRRFDDFLRTLIPASVDRRALRLKTVIRETDRFRLQFDDLGRVQEITCRRLIAADGGGSRARRALFLARRPNTLTAIQAHYDADRFPPVYACYYDKRCTPAFGWSLVKDNRLIVGGAFARHGSSAAFAEFERAVFGYLGTDVPKRLVTEACPVVWSTSARDICLGEDDALLVGEAAGLISPSSLEGISFALESGYAAGSIYGRGGGLRDYRAAIRHLLAKHAARRGKARLLAIPAVRNAVMRSGVTQIRPIDHLRD